MENPAKAGPTTEAICQTELLKSCIRIYFLYNNDKKEKIVGPRNTLTNPPGKQKINGI
jgi:hypothetical protein